MTQQSAPVGQRTWAPTPPYLPVVSQPINFQQIVSVLPGNNLPVIGVQSSLGPQEGIAQGRGSHENGILYEKSGIEVGRKSEQKLKPIGDKTAAKQLLNEPNSQVSGPAQQNILDSESPDIKLDICPPLTAQFQNTSNANLIGKYDFTSEN